MKRESLVGFVYVLLNDLLKKNITKEEAKEILQKNFSETSKNTYEARGIVVKILGKKAEVWIEREGDPDTNPPRFSALVADYLDESQILNCVFSLLESFAAYKFTQAKFEVTFTTNYIKVNITI